jgi:hypothetical protein
MADPTVEDDVLQLGDVETRRGLYEAMTTSFEAVLAAMPHIGCDACKAPREVKRCRCQCHIDYYVEDLPLYG